MMEKKMDLNKMAEVTAKMAQNNAKAEEETTLYINGVPVRVASIDAKFVQDALKERDELRRDAAIKPHIQELRRELTPAQVKESERLWQTRYTELQRQFKETQKFLKMAQNLNLQQDVNAAMKRIHRLSAELSKLDEEKLNKALTSPKEILGERIGTVIDGVEYVIRSKAEEDLCYERRKASNKGLLFGTIFGGLMAYDLYKTYRDNKEDSDHSK